MMSALTLRARRVTNIAHGLYGAVTTYTDSDAGRDLTADETRRYLADSDAWWNADTLPELANLTADWIEGKNLYLPAYDAASPDPETRPLIQTLADINRARLMTDCSQPGKTPRTGYDGWTWQQLAAVSGFCDLATVVSLQDAATATDGLYFYAWVPGATFQRRPRSERRPELFEIPATIRENPATGEGWINTVFGPPHSRRELRQIYRGDLNPAAIKTLQNSWQVTIADTEYGRNDRLWPLLADWAKQREATV